MPSPSQAGDTPVPRFRLGCSGHLLLALIALVVSSLLAGQSLREQAASTGRGVNPDAMGIFLTLFFPLVYVGMLVVYKIIQFVARRVGGRGLTRPEED
jgi:uncharacterized membrane protein